MSMRILINFAVSIVIALVLIFVIRGLANTIFAVEKPAKPAVAVPMTEETEQKKEEKAAPAKEETAAPQQTAQAEQKPAAQPAEQVPATEQPQQQAAAAPAGGDPEAGKKVFKKCKSCHFADKKKNKVGPYLLGVVGRKAGSVPDFKYSDAMKAKGEEGLVWTEENLHQYLKAPKKFVPGNKMAFAGLKKDKDIADLIAYLKSNQ